VGALTAAMTEFITSRVAGDGPLSNAHALALASALVPPLLSAVEDAPRSAALEQLLGVVAAVAALPVPGREAGTELGMNADDADEDGESTSSAASLLASTQAKPVGVSAARAAFMMTDAVWEMRRAPPPHPRHSHTTIACHSKQTRRSKR
jgi:hypothetical protein